MIATDVSMVLGLGMTRLLLGLVTVFRTRSISPVDWLPLTWAAVIFVMMLQYWWAINRLPLVMTNFFFVNFSYIIVLTLMLFLSAALLLPSREEDEVGTFARSSRLKAVTASSLSPAFWSSPSPSTSSCSAVRPSRFGACSTFR